MLRARLSDGGRQRARVAPRLTAVLALTVVLLTAFVDGRPALADAAPPHGEPGGMGVLVPAVPADTPYPGRLLGRGLVGEDVRQLQAYLVSQGATLKVDGIYGPRTAKAVRDLQRRTAVAVDGIVGPLMRRFVSP
jgi:peptidoglycan hydrolase-like protein with peptidoglycan-binding domain